MPTYEYRCPAGHVFEKFFPTMHDKQREKCPICGQQAERLISGGAGFVFKGSGFYSTDYKRPAPTPETRDGESKPSEAKPTESEPTESKPADQSKKDSKKDSSDK